MADNEKDVTKKEAAQGEEKEKDTAESKGSKPGSAKSVAKSDSAKSDKEKKSAKGGKASKGKKKKEEEKPAEEEAPAAEDAPETLPEGAVPIFLSSKTQEIFECRADEDVTDDIPFKIIMKEDIMKDFFNRAAVCDFHPVKEQIQNYPTDEILVVYDPDFKWGQNFIVALTEEAKEALLKGPEAEAEGEEGAVSKTPEEEVVYTYIPPVSKPWESYGSEIEIEEEACVSRRPLVKFTVKRKRRDFGEFIEFTDSKPTKDSIQECVAFEDKTFDLNKVEVETGMQAVPDIVTTATQTDWKFPRNACTQYEHRTFTDEQRNAIEQDEKLKAFIREVTPRFELALQQNCIMDVFFDDWANLGDDDSSFGSKADNHLKEYQSFTDLQFSKDKTVTCIDWHPTIRGVVAVSVGEKVTFDDRIDNAHRIIMTPSLILIWSFTDPIHPQLLLEAPDDIKCFKFSPTDSNIIAGGCVNGQVVLWDISQHTERLKAPRGGKKKALNTLPGFEDENALDTPIVRYCAVSSIENSHKFPITDIAWVPDHFEVNRMGVPHENTSGNCVQIMTCACDHSVLFWDTRPPKAAQSLLTQNEKKKDQIINPLGVPTTFKHLDLVWKPHLKVTLYKSEPGGDHSPIKFSIAEAQGNKDMGFNEESKAVDGANTGAGAFSMGAAGRGGSGSAKRTLSTVKTHFYIGTEDGEIVYVDWMPQKDQDSGKIQTPKPDYYRTIHDGPINTLQRSPFFRDVVLCVGGWSFSIWREGVSSGPVLQSCASSKRYTAGHWSPSRPSVFFIAKQDGSVDIWDLLDRTHEPSMNQSITPAPITCLFPYQVTTKQHLLGVGDSSGTLHILEIPWSLRQPTPNEHNAMLNYIDREVKRRAFVVQRWDFREKEKMELEQEKKNKAGIAPQVLLTEDEMEYRMKQEYQQYLEAESTFLRDLGLLKEDDDMLAETD